MKLRRRTPVREAGNEGVSPQKANMEKHLKIAIFIDFDNIEIGVKSTLQREFDVSVVLEALKERGEIVTKIAYANWGRMENSTRQLSEYAVQMVQRDPSPRGDKNGADINLALDALEMAFTHDHINAFTIVSGDSDFIALVNKLKQYDKTVFVVGGKAFTSTILQKNCHEFISYESMLDDSRSSRSHRDHGREQGGRDRQERPAISGGGGSGSGDSPLRHPANRGRLVNRARASRANRVSRAEASNVVRLSICIRPCRSWNARCRFWSGAKCGRSWACSNPPCSSWIPVSASALMAQDLSPISSKSFARTI